MKLALNGALTIGTLDGANIEIGEESARTTSSSSASTVREVTELRARGYNPWDYYNRDEELAGCDRLARVRLLHPLRRVRIAPVHSSLLHGGDPFMVLADFRAYSDCQARIDAAYRDRDKWARMAILNTARCGWFSSDRTVREYADEIWKLPRAADLITAGPLGDYPGQNHFSLGTCSGRIPAVAYRWSFVLARQPFDM